MRIKRHVLRAWPRVTSSTGTPALVARPRRAEMHNSQFARRREARSTARYYFPSIDTPGQSSFKCKMLRVQNRDTLPCSFSPRYARISTGLMHRRDLFDQIFEILGFLSISYSRLRMRVEELRGVLSRHRRSKFKSPFRVFYTAPELAKLLETRDTIDHRKREPDAPFPTADCEAHQGNLEDDGF